jgi:hypothetical protein
VARSSWAVLLVPHLRVTADHALQVSSVNSPSHISRICWLVGHLVDLSTGSASCGPIFMGSTRRDPSFMDFASCGPILIGSSSTHRGPAFKGSTHCGPSFMGFVSRGPILMDSTHRGPTFKGSTHRGPASSCCRLNRSWSYVFFSSCQGINLYISAFITGVSLITTPFLFDCMDGYFILIFIFQ